MNKALLILAVFWIGACSGPKNEELEGAWRLDSVSTPEGSKIKYDKTLEITFLKESIFKKTWWDFDVGNTYTGKVYATDNAARQVRTLTLIPDLIIVEKDTIRLPAENWDLLRVTSQELIVVEPTRFLPRERKESIRFNQLKYFKRIKE